MSFKAGDFVVHPTYGVGSIVRLEEKRLAGDQTRWYYVVVVDKSTVWVPVDENNSAGLRAVTPKKDLDRYRAVLKGQPEALERDHNKRRLIINERVKQGSFQSLCEAVRNLSAQSWKRPLSEADLTLLQRLSHSLYREWAASANVSLPVATAEVQALLQEAKQTYKV
ncbi:MAG TPA: CarD family transcriptional regulator [Anaerolineae bacterium]|nr:CarD family transcriptional regulator [Anaerolineae bacterium]